MAHRVENDHARGTGQPRGTDQPRGTGQARGAAKATMPLLLMYHSVAPYEEDPYLVTVRPQRFEQQMRWLRRRGLRGTSVRELLDARRSGTGRGLVGLTFDDGYADFVQHALPILTRHGFTATLFAVVGRLGGDNAWDANGPRKALMSARQVRQAAAAGIEIGSHSLRHVRLPAATDAALAEEVEQSRRLLQGASGQEVSGFCYPYGDLDGRVLDAVRAAAMTTAARSGARRSPRGTPSPAPTSVTPTRRCGCARNGCATA